MKPGDNLINQTMNNSYHASSAEFPLSAEKIGAIGALKREVSDLVRLELTAEQMLGEEVDLARAYLREDVHSIWTDLKLGLYEWELITADWLLRAADPTRVDWQLHHWWGDEGHLH